MDCTNTTTESWGILGPEAKSIAQRQRLRHQTLPCCLIKTPTLLHRDKNSRNYVTRISFLCKKQEFSSASFPHVFKAIGPLEKILETKNHFFSPFKKVTFSVSRILNAKTKKSDVFWTHFLNLDFIWGKSRFLKLVFLPFVSSIKIHVFYWKYCLSVLLWFQDFEFFSLSAYYIPSTFHVD